jgi:DNA-binding NtrC family response regulator
MVSPDGDKGEAVVIDDDSLIRFVLSSALEQNGYQVTDVANVAEALPHAAEAQLVILDANIPGERCDVSLTAIRAASPDVGIIVISGAPVRHEALDDARAEFLLKPLSIDDLLTTAAKVRRP